MARTYKSFAQPYICKTHCGYYLLLEVPYSKKVGNDLSTPMPQYNFAGVQPGQSWCLGGHSFVKAVHDGMAPQIFIHATHIKMLELIDLETLKEYAIDL